MRNVSFHDFDEAHRAETAKRMKEYGSFFVPLTGSPWDRAIELNVPVKGGPFLHLYYHLERPPLVYLLMILSISIFGSSEFAYRLPSFLLGISVFLLYYVLAQKLFKKIDYWALYLGLLVLFTSSDLWLSAQYAQLDTGLTFFLFTSLLLLILYVEKRKRILLYLSGFAFALAILSKGQPAITFVFPILFLLIFKKISVREIARFGLSAGVLIVPWVLYLSIAFGLTKFVQLFFGFAFLSATVADLNQKAPFFWYLRWFWESLRPGWTLFLAFLILDIFRNNFSWKKLVLLSYIFGSLLALSLPINKLWWYVLPIIPALATYIYLSASDYLKKFGKRGLLPITLILLLSSLRIFFGVPNKATLFYGIGITSVTALILTFPFLNKSLKGRNMFAVLFFFSFAMSLLAFYTRFPKIMPYNWEAKPVGQYFVGLPEPKCLWVRDSPVEAILFYSNAKEIEQFNANSNLYRHCKNYLIIHGEYDDEIKQLLENKKVLYRVGTFRLIAL